MAFLDSKAAFDVVSHASLFRKLFNIGIDGQCWNMTHQMHQNATSCVKWKGVLSSMFDIEQGARQGGILSTDLYKVYNNPLIRSICDAGISRRLGGVSCGAPTVADDITVMSDT